MKKNILFLVIDSFRADSCYGQKKTSITPNMDSLIDSGTYFLQAISSAGSTGSALASIFTSLFPFKTGMGSETYHKLDSNVQSFVHILQQQGYVTYAASPPTTDALGLTDNFEKKDTHYYNYESIFSGLGEKIIESFKSKKMKEPWFFYLHINDLHQPIIVPKEFDKKKFGISKYERMISAIDNWIGKIIKNIDLRNTLIILTSDHGDYVPVLYNDNIINFESSKTEQTLWKLGNRVPKFLRPVKVMISKILHDLRAKQKSKKIDNLDLTTYEKRVITSIRMGPGHHMFDDIVNVPLIFSGCGIKNMKIKQQVRHVDIFPTILDLLGLDYNYKNIHGISLSPLFHNEPLNELPAYIESPPTLNKSKEKSIGLRTSEFKYIRPLEFSKEKIELYDLKKDPLEEKNIAQERQDVVQKFEKTLTELRKDSISEEEMSEEETKRIEEELRKLGYI